MIDAIVEKAKGFIMNPVETFRQSREDEPATIFSYFIALLVVNAILSAIVAAAVVGSTTIFAGLNLGGPFPVIVFFAVLVAGFIFTLIFAAWVHLWVYLFGGRKGIMQTMTAIIYGHTPRLLFGWIPVLGFLFVLWSLVLNIIGIRELQELTTMKAILVLAIAVLIPLILIILAFVAFFTIASTTVLPSPEPVTSLLR
jgi:hypothetical protein